jgi:hypothetical protein
MTQLFCGGMAKTCGVIEHQFGAKDKFGFTVNPNCDRTHDLRSCRPDAMAQTVFRGLFRHHRD